MKYQSSPRTILSFVVLFVLFGAFNITACSSDLSDEATPAPAAATASPTAAPVTVKARTLVNLNLRQGPGTSYPKVGSLPVDAEVTIVGKNEDGSWLLVESDSGQVWISASSDLVEFDQASLATLPVVEAPPLAYDASNVNVDQVLNQIPLVVDHGGRHTCASHGGLNNLLPDVVTGHVISPHSGDFVMGSDNVLFEYANGTFQLIRENPVARFEDGEKYLSFEQAMQMFASGEIVWTGSPGEWPARGVTGCDPSAQP